MTHVTTSAYLCPPPLISIPPFPVRPQQDNPATKSRGCTDIGALILYVICMVQMTWIGKDSIATVALISLFGL